MDIHCGCLLNYFVVTLYSRYPNIKVVLDTNVIISSIKITTILSAWWWFYFHYDGGSLIYARYYIVWISMEHGSARTNQLQLRMILILGKIALRIQQNYLRISVNSFSESYQNYSYSELVKFDEKSNTYGINYTYSQKENDLFDVAQRNGTSELTFKLIGGEPWLEGDFWTIHGTKGKLKVKRIYNKQIDTFLEGAGNCTGDGKMKYIYIDGDDIGLKIEKSFMTNDEMDLQAINSEVNRVITQLADDLSASGCEILFSGADGIILKTQTPHIEYIHSILDSLGTALTFSIGVGGSLREAFLALRYAKANGKNGVAILDNDFIWRRNCDRKMQLGHIHLGGN
jgi:hypothetical protein